MTTETAVITSGLPAPDIELTSADGERVRLSALWQVRPLVLAFLGDLGNPFSGDNAAQLRDAREAIDQAGAGLAAIAAAEPAQTAAFEARWALPYPVLCDPAREAVGRFGAQPSGIFLIDAAGTVRYVRVNPNLADYPPAVTIIEAVCAVTGAQPPAQQESAVAALERHNNVRQDAQTVAFQRFSCAKCGYNDCERNQISTSGGFLTRIFNWQNRRFITVTCRSCGFTELYKRNVGKMAGALDLLTLG